MKKHKYSITLLVLAAAWYAIFGLLLPQYVYSDPKMETEAAAHAVRAIGELLKSIAPWLSALMVGQAIILFFRERRM